MREIEFTLDTIEEAARKFISETKGADIILFEGEMGAGKTTFITEICRILGAEDHLGSPTFSIVNEYGDSNGKPIYHFDFYRIESPQEALDIGVEDYFYSGNMCLVEWPDRLGSLVPEEALTVKITEEPGGIRKIIF